MYLERGHSTLEDRANNKDLAFVSLLVIDGLDFLKKENAGARDSIRYLEAEFKKGNRYVGLPSLEMVLLAKDKLFF